ncbi:DUF2274 domain-containing protein [Caballeronia sp. LjRoot34]|uniref:DUF2274 domain-containing protein n=1 Tax=Caballeronia sp. LjRoot34 TaxID=3342325 RepID=UPI003ECFD972
MSASSKKLRLGPLSDMQNVKLTFACPAPLKADLDRYAALHAQTYGEPVDVATLILLMLEAFMTGDRGFRKVTTTDSSVNRFRVAMTGALGRFSSKHEI